MSAVVAANLGVLLEVGALGAFVVWGATSADGPAGWLPWTGAAAAFAGAWGIFVSPGARVRLVSGARLAVEFALLGAVALALAARDRRRGSLRRGEVSSLWSRSSAARSIT